MSASALATTQPTDICMTVEDMMCYHQSIIDRDMSELVKNNRILMCALYEVPDTEKVDDEVYVRVKLAKIAVQQSLKNLEPDLIDYEVFCNVKLVKSEGEGV
jgi:hypothetical protein